VTTRRGRACLTLPAPPPPYTHPNTHTPLVDRGASGLPFYDVMVLGNLPKSASLPVATVQVRPLFGLYLGPYSSSI